MNIPPYQRKSKMYTSIAKQLNNANNIHIQVIIYIRPQTDEGKTGLEDPPGRTHWVLNGETWPT